MVNIIEELKAKFKVANIAGRGRCIIIPVDKFQAEWDQQILEAGCDAHGDGDAIYVHIDRYKPQPEKSHKTVTRGSNWSDYDTALLIKLWKAKDKTIPQIAEHFPDRTESSVTNRLHRLRDKGLIEGRWGTTRSKKKEPQVSAKSENPEAPEAPAPEHPSLEGMFEKVFELLHRQACRQLMQHLLLRELKGDFVIPRKLWRLYWEALDIRPDKTLGPPKEYMLRFQKAANEFLLGYM